MKTKLNIKSKSGIHKLLLSLEDKGFISRVPYKARALMLNNSNQTNINNLETEIPFLEELQLETQ